MSVAFLPEGYSPGDLLVLPVFVSDPDERVSEPEGWSLFRDAETNDPFEHEQDNGFYTAFWKVATDNEPDEIELEASDEEAQVVGQILAFENSSGQGWTLPPRGYLGEGSSPVDSLIEESPGESPGEESPAEEESPGEGPHNWVAETFQQANVQAGDAFAIITVLNRDNSLSEDTLNIDGAPYGEGAYGDGSYGSNASIIQFSPVIEEDSAYTGAVTFRSATSGVEWGTTTLHISHFAETILADSGIWMLLSVRGLDSVEVADQTEGQVLDAEKFDDEVFHIREGRNEFWEDEEIFDFEYGAIPFISEFSIVFNESRRAPGFNITLRGLLEFSEIEVIRRDTTGQYPDENVRGLTRQLTIDDEMFVADYEAPLNRIVHYYIRLVDGTGGEFFFGPVLPTPQPYIPTLSDAYGGGTTYMKPIDIPEISQPVMIEDMSEWDRPANVMAEHHILGRRNKVVISDVRGGREGSLRGHCILNMGQDERIVEEIFNSGTTILIQNHNPTLSAFPDMYVQVSGVSFERLKTTNSWHGELDNPSLIQKIVHFECDYTQVDRPDPSGVEVPNSIWQLPYDTAANWNEVKNNRITWLDVLARPSFAAVQESGVS